MQEGAAPALAAARAERGLVALEKTLPWRRLASTATTAVLGTIGILLLAAPAVLPGLTIPGPAMQMGAG